jgi:hypothetical protein
MSHKLTSKRIFGSPPQKTLAARIQKLLISVKEKRRKAVGGLEFSLARMRQRASETFKFVSRWPS